MKVVELRATQGLAMIAGVPLTDHLPDGRTWGLPPELIDSLQEWARVASTLRDHPGVSGGTPLTPGVSNATPIMAGDPGAVTVSRRGRHLAARLSVVLDAPVDYCDPTTGERVALRGVTRTPHPPPVALPARGTGEVGSSPPRRAEAPPAEPTPWATGLVLAAIVAGLVLLANLALASPLITGLGVIGLVVDAAVVAGLVPALWLNRRAPTWRWAVYGTFAGTGAALVALAITVL